MPLREMLPLGCDAQDVLGASPRQAARWSPANRPGDDTKDREYPRSSLFPAYIRFDEVSHDSQELFRDFAADIGGTNCLVVRL